MSDSSSLTPDGHVSEWFGRLMFETAEAAGIKVSEARVRIYAADLKDRDATLRRGLVQYRD